MDKPQLPWRSLYRALIRECGYLPDPVAKHRMHDYIRMRFRQHSSPSKQPMHQKWLNIHHKRANKYLNLLKRANEGYLKPLERVLLLSYGRIGHRKHDLLDPLLIPDTPGLETKKYSSDWEPPKVILELAKSQSKQVAITELGTKPRMKALKLKLNIPEKNSWGRSMPVRRQVNMRRDWYSELVSGVLPPIPDEDWKILQHLAAGKAWSPPKRRKSPERDQQEPDRRGLDAEFLAFGPRKGFTYAMYERGRPHKIKPRLMQHLWRRISILTPRMTWNSTSDKWEFEWGMVQGPPPIYRQVEPVKGLALFEGVNQKTGALLKN